MRRTALVWLVLFAAYLATLGLHAFGSAEYAGDEPHYLLAAKSLVLANSLSRAAMASFVRACISTMRIASSGPMRGTGKLYMFIALRLRGDSPAADFR